MSRKSLAARQWLAAERTLTNWLPPGDPTLADSGVDGVVGAVGDMNAEAGSPSREAHYLGRQLRTGPAANRHDANIRAFSVDLALPVDWTLFGIWLTMLVHRHGAKILRIKGILNVLGSETPVAVHGVQHLIHPPVHMAAWPNAERHSRLVFIVKGLERATIQRSLNAFIQTPAPLP